MRIIGFPPIARADARVLVLGTMPSPASLAAGFYYAHPRNAFWPIMGTLFGFDPRASAEVRAQALMRARIALWDVCHACVREGSADASIREVEPNDFASFFARHPEIMAVFCNGQSAYRLFLRHVARKTPELVHNRRIVVLPSTSPAAATLSFAQKLARWRKAFVEQSLLL